MREKGYYWLTDLERPRHLVAHYRDGIWTFMNSLWMIEDDEVDEDTGELMMSRYRIGDRIPEPEA